MTCRKKTPRGRISVSVLLVPLTPVNNPIKVEFVFVAVVDSCWFVLVGCEQRFVWLVSECLKLVE